MSVPLPAPGTERLGPPDAAEVAVLGRGVVTAVTPPDGITDLQQVLITSMFDAMTGHPVDTSAAPLSAPELAAALADRNEAFRTRIVQVMLLGALVLRPLPEEVADRVGAYARELSVDDGMLAVARRFASGSLGLAAFDFERNCYTASWSAEDKRALHTSDELASAWALAPDDPALAARWRALEDLPEGTIGRRMTEFYRARGFAYPGVPDSAPPLLAQHDWVHLVAHYGTTVESELEVFAFIARANEDPRAFSLLAMVVSLFETGYLRSGAGLFESAPGQLSRDGVAVRLADALRRGALCRDTATGDDSVDFFRFNWFSVADRPVAEVQERFALAPKSDTAVAAGSVGPWEPGGISEHQWNVGREAAERAGRPYESFGASVG
jgi:hypothetical protein